MQPESSYFGFSFAKGAGATRDRREAGKRRRALGRPSPQKQISGNRVRGRGMSYVKYELARTYVGAVAEVEVDRASGDIRVTKIFVTHDCGQIINPDGLRNQLDGNILQTVSRVLQ